MLIKDTLSSMGADVVMVSVDGDSNEDAALLKRYAERNGFSWRFAVAPRDFMGSLAAEFGNSYLNPPSDPLFVISAKAGQAHRLPAARSDDRPGGSTRWLGLAVLAGVLSMMLLIGAIIALLSVAIGSVLVFITPLADLLVIGLGVALLFGLNPFARLPMLARGGTRGSPLLNAYVYGLLYGPIVIPCSGPLLVAIFTLSLTVDAYLDKLAFFLAFGFGFGVPLLLISLIAAGRSAALLRLFLRHYGAIARIAGIVLIGVGLRDLASNLPFVLLYLGA